MENLMIKTVIPLVSTRYGAPMGRWDIGTAPDLRKPLATIRVYNQIVPMSPCGAYDKGGAYWGVGQQLRVKFTKDLSYIQFYRGNPMELKKKKEARLNDLYSDAYSEDEAVEAFIYLANKTRNGMTTTESHIRHCSNNYTLGTLLRRLDPIAFNAS